MAWEVLNLNSSSQCFLDRPFLAYLSTFITNGTRHICMYAWWMPGRYYRSLQESKPPGIQTTQIKNHHSTSRIIVALIPPVIPVATPLIVVKGLGGTSSWRSWAGINGGVCKLVCVRGRLLLGGYILAIEQVGIYAESANLPTRAVFSSGACCIIFSVLWYLPFIARVTRDSSTEGVHKAERITSMSRDHHLLG